MGRLLALLCGDERKEQNDHRHVKCIAGLEGGKNEMVNMKALVRKKMAKQKAAWGIDFIDASIQTIEKYYDDLEQIESEMKEIYPAEDFGDPSFMNTAAGELRSEKKKVLELIAQKKMAQTKPRARLR